MLIYLAETAGLQLHLRDQFGYSILDYSLVYKKLYCFIFIYFKCKQTELNSDLIPNIIDTLLSQKDPISTKMLQIILREKELSKMLAPPMIVAAIRHGRLDVVEDVYQNCIYLPEMARS